MELSTIKVGSIFRNFGAGFIVLFDIKIGAEDMIICLLGAITLQARSEHLYKQYLLFTEYHNT